MVAQGLDPSKEKQTLKVTAKLEAQNTFEAIAREWHQHHKERWSSNHANTVMRRLEQGVFPAIGGLVIREITPPILLGVLRDIEKRNAFEMARRALQMTGQVFVMPLSQEELSGTYLTILKGL